MGSFNPWSLLTGGVSGLFGLGTTAMNNQAEKVMTDRTNASNRQIAAETNATNLQIARENTQLQREENALNRDFNASQAEEAFQRELDKMFIQHQYNSPIELVRQMREAGLNPASASGGNYTTAMASSGQASYNTGLTPAMPNIMPSFNQKPNIHPFPNIIDGMLDGALKLAQVKKIGADTGLSEAQSNQINKTLEQSLRLLTVNADQAEFIHFLDTAFAPLERVQGFEAKKSEIAVNWQMALKLASEGELIKAKEANEKVLTGLYEAQKKLTGAQADEVRERIDWMAPLNTAKINELYASAEEKRVSAQYSREKILTEKEARLGVISDALSAWDEYQKSHPSEKQIELIKEKAEQKLEEEVRHGSLDSWWNPATVIAAVLHPVCSELGIVFSGNASVSSSHSSKKVVKP